MKRSLPEVLVKELEQWPGVAFHYERRTGHPRLHLRVGEQERFLVISSTPSCPRANLNKRRDLRQLLAQMGATRSNE